jgi:hypothetical protein
LGQASQRTNEKYGKRIGKTSELVFPSYQVVSKKNSTISVFGQCLTRK